MQLPIEPEKATALLLIELPKRSNSILEKRFGLAKGGKRFTLDAIGKTYGITRERVRQIEQDSMARLRRGAAYKKLEPAFQAFRGYIEEKGGAVAEATLMADFGAATPMVNPVRFLLTLANPFHYAPQDEHFYARWSTAKPVLQNIERTVSAMVDTLKRAEKVFTREDIISMLAKKSGEYVAGPVNTDVLTSYLGLSKRVSSNTFGQWGHADLPLINPRGVRDMAYLVFQKHGKPLHFSKVAGLVSTQIAKRNVHVQTVHNELIKDNRFVLIGRGTYGLAEWGFEPGTVRDVALHILADGPLSREEVARLVLERRQVKENTVFINLQNRSYFKKLPDGRYTRLA